MLAYMSVLGVGVDVIEIGRLKEALERFPRLEARLFTPHEMEEGKRRGNAGDFLAGRFAAKEAVAKALGRSFLWREVEVLRGANGRPEVTLHGRAAERSKGVKVLVSISHCRDYAVAQAIAINEE